MASEPMTTEELEDATRYVECGETKFGEGWAEERNIPLLRRLLDENARLNTELESLRVHNGVLVTEIRFQGDRAERMRVERDRAISECDDWETKYAELSVERDALRRALPVAPEMPRPPAEEAQERPETPGTGSGRGTGVAEDENPAQECDHWFTDVAEAVRPAHYRQAAGELLALVAHFEHIGSERTEWMAGLRDGAEHLARSTSDAAPSLPVPSTGE